jgi:hypothetical protein
MTGRNIRNVPPRIGVRTRAAAGGMGRHTPLPSGSRIPSFSMTSMAQRDALK